MATTVYEREIAAAHCAAALSSAESSYSRALTSRLEKNARRLGKARGKRLG